MEKIRFSLVHYNTIHTVCDNIVQCSVQSLNFFFFLSLLLIMHLQLFGCGSVAQVTTTQEQKGQYLSINLGFALGVTFGVFVARGVSGEVYFCTLVL